jgi:hypothetical protein
VGYVSFHVTILLVLIGLQTSETRKEMSERETAVRRNRIVPVVDGSHVKKSLARAVVAATPTLHTKQRNVPGGRVSMYAQPVTL